MDKDYFLECRNMVISKKKPADKIGVLAEKTIHSILKQYVSKDINKQEIKIGTYYADVIIDDHIYEIQTRGFDKLRTKLSYFLENYKVTVVYPVAYINYLRWIFPDNGQITDARKSPKRGNPLEVVPELYKIRPFLSHPNFSLKIMMMNMEEFRMLDGWSKDKKKGSTKCDKYPTELVAEYDIESSRDYVMFFSPDLAEEFTAKEFAKSSHVSVSVADIFLLLMTEQKVVERIGKRGRAYLYRLNEF